jgi:hypothetical protein
MIQSVLESILSKLIKICQTLQTLGITMFEGIIKKGGNS